MKKLFCKEKPEGRRWEARKWTGHKARITVNNLPISPTFPLKTILGRRANMSRDLLCSSYLHSFLTHHKTLYRQGGGLYMEKLCSKVFKHLAAISAPTFFLRTPSVLLSLLQKYLLDVRDTQLFKGHGHCLLSDCVAEVLIRKQWCSDDNKQHFRKSNRFYQLYS